MKTAPDLLRWRKYLKGLLTPDGDAQPDAVLLVGSWSRPTKVGPLSDLDVLVVNGEMTQRPPPGIQTIHLSLDELRHRVAAGDDFAQWSLRFGIPLKGRRIWERVRDDLLRDAPWPDPQRKYRQARDRLRASQALLEMGDVDAAQDEARYALSHLARGILLEGHEFPGSRPELPAQLRDVEQNDLAQAMEYLETLDVLSAARLREILRLASTLVADAEGA